MDVKTTRLLTPAEVATRTHISESTLAKWRINGRESLRFVKLGRAVFYRETDLEDWIAAQVRRSTSDAGADRAA